MGIGRHELGEHGRDIPVSNLLQLPAAPTALYDLTSVDRWINIARGQVAGEGECIRAIGTTLAAAVRCGRRGISCDLRLSQVRLTRRRLMGVTPSLFGGQE